MNKRALLNVDYTYDFVASDGKLTCGKPGQDIETAIVQVTQNFFAANDYIVFAIDKHEKGDVYHPESKLFPEHNVAGTAGRELYGSLQDWYEKNKQATNVYYIDKTRYSAFAGTDLEIKLRERGIEEVHIVGVCTDICVLHTAIDAYNKGFRIVLYSDAMASFNEAGHEWALTHFTNTLGAKVITVA
ncbi:cysteine hydrolase family protein [Lederbergia galactosidilytica]|uniref:Isochorismatase n=1 Tax=Lederbergia galactosidilytica TaxID=217031 RepID=A0A177ZNK4_9BACI|nr:isochorismatase family cysteine hydrolase [Lederbergia galactosidilytica]KRG13184.1 isochorismatase [Virgibacillus soli]OAK69009.1 isochorismatase [Lederbergia galactosidilytica]